MIPALGKVQLVPLTPGSSLALKTLNFLAVLVNFQVALVAPLTTIARNGTNGTSPKSIFSIKDILHVQGALGRFSPRSSNQYQVPCCQIQGRSQTEYPDRSCSASVAALWAVLIRHVEAEP